uniref:Putative secreted protein n=1 Tax=Ixodes ricinus TaxID=34613 RepID=A0A6B0UGU8_IXORI
MGFLFPPVPLPRIAAAAVAACVWPCGGRSRVGSPAALRRPQRPSFIAAACRGKPSKPPPTLLWSDIEGQPKRIFAAYKKERRKVKAYLPAIEASRHVRNLAKERRR